MIKLKPGGQNLVKQVAKLASSPIKNQGTCDAMNIGISKLKKMLKFIDEHFKDYTAEWKQAVKEATFKRNAVKYLIEKAIGEGATAVRVWDDEQLRIQQEAEERARLEAEEEERKAKAETERRRKISAAQKGPGNIKPVEIPPIKKIVPYKARQSTQYRKNWTYTVTDFSKLPEEYKSPNHEKIMQAMKDSKNSSKDPTIEIPGLEWTCEKIRIN